MKTDLKGGCFILSPDVDAGAGLKSVIGRGVGAKHLSQQVLIQEGELSPILAYGASDVVLFVITGHPLVNIAGKEFQAGPESGLYVRPGEAFRVDPGNTRVKMLITVCPEPAGFTITTRLGDNFDQGLPERLVAVDAEKREAMGDRFYQVLVSKDAGSEQVTQFIGEIPKSKAPSHHHLYEEALYVLEGKGFMWTEDVKGAVGPGSIIFLPARQDHSLECTSDSGLHVVGHFYPAGSPAENY